MAISNAHFAKLRDFITLRLPPGFPVKIGECEESVFNKGWSPLEEQHNDSLPGLGSSGFFSGLCLLNFSIHHSLLLWFHLPVHCCYRDNKLSESPKRKKLLLSISCLSFLLRLKVFFATWRMTFLVLLHLITSSSIKLSVPPEIPLFHVLNARVTFSNLCGCDEPVSSVIVHKPEGSEETGNNPFTNSPILKMFFSGWLQWSVMSRNAVWVQRNLLKI